MDHPNSDVLEPIKFVIFINQPNQFVSIHLAQERQSFVFPLIAVIPDFPLALSVWLLVGLDYNITTSRGHAE